MRKLVLLASVLGAFSCFASLDPVREAQRAPSASYLPSLMARDTNWGNCATKLIRLVLARTQYRRLFLDAMVFNTYDPSVGNQTRATASKPDGTTFEVLLWVNYGNDICYLNFERPEATDILRLQRPKGEPVLRFGTVRGLRGGNHYYCIGCK